MEGPAIHMDESPLKRRREDVMAMNPIENMGKTPVASEVESPSLNVPMDVDVQQTEVKGKGKGKAKGKGKGKGKGKAKGKGKGKMMAAEDESPSMESWPYMDYPEDAPRGHLTYTCLQTWDASGDSKVLRFALPEGVKTLGAFGVLSCVKAKQEIGGYLLDKSYCPVSHPDVEGYVDLLVKRYDPQPGTGMSDFLCSRKPGDQVPMMLKPPRKVGKGPYYANRFKEMVLIGAGTGVAPLIQMGQVIFDDPSETTKVHFLVGQRSESDMLLQDRIDGWVKARPHQFTSHVTLSRPRDPEAWKQSGGTVGRIDASFLKAYMPPPAVGVAVLVCGADEFLDSVCGDKQMVTIPGTEYQQKVRGPITGILGTLGFDDDNGPLVVKL